MTARLSALLIDDDARLAALVREYLGRNDIDVTAVSSGEAGLDALRHARYDVVLLDLTLPGVDGLEVCRRLRAASDERARVPLIMLTARGDEVDRVVGLELGADDYLAKPFSPRELLARIRAVHRRAAPPAPVERLRSGPLEIDLAAREVKVDGRPVGLTYFEFELLAVLARAAGRVLSREQLVDALKGEELDHDDRSIDVHISRLRAKIERNPHAPAIIRTVRGVGYVLTRE